jgi:GT2 family glycosyltransferase
MNSTRTPLNNGAQMSSNQDAYSSTTESEASECGRAETLSVSLLIATKNRADELGLAVRSVLRQSVLPIEILILDQSATDRGREVVQSEFASVPFDAEKRIALRYLRDPSVPGTAAARNRLLDLARGDVALFIDDDSCLEPDFIEQMRDCYLDRPDIVGISGMITNYKRPPWNARCWSMIFDRGPFHDERQPLYWNADGLRGAGPIRVRKFTGASMSFRMEVIRHLRFNADLIGASREEDVDFCAMLDDRVLVIAPRARLAHNKSPINRTQGHWLKEHAQSAYYLYRRHWNRGFKNRACFCWLRTGYCVAVTVGCIRRFSLAPWQAFQAGLRRAIELTSGPAGGETAMALSGRHEGNAEAFEYGRDVLHRGVLHREVLQKD